jgi:hypothetical protein
MDHVEAAAPHESLELEESDGVLHRMEGPDQGREDVECDPGSARRILEISLRARIRTSEESDVHSHPLLVRRREERILLGAAHDEPGDDVENAESGVSAAPGRLPFGFAHARLRVVGDVHSC